MQSVLNYAWPKSQIGDYKVQNQLQSMMWVLRKQNWRIIRPRALFLDQLSQITFILNGRLFSKLFSLDLDSQAFLGSHSRRNHLVLLLDSNELIYSSTDCKMVNTIPRTQRLLRVAINVGSHSCFDGFCLVLRLSSVHENQHSTFQNSKSTLKKKRPMVSLFAYLHSISFPMKVIIPIFQWIDQRSFYVLFGLLLFYSSDLALTDILDFT